MTVIGTGGTDRGMEAAREHGADFVFSHHDPNYLDAIMKTRPAAAASTSSSRWPRTSISTRT